MELCLRASVSVSFIASAHATPPPSVPHPLSFLSSMVVIRLSVAPLLHTSSFALWIWGCGCHHGKPQPLSFPSGGTLGRGHRVTPGVGLPTPSFAFPSFCSPRLDSVRSLLFSASLLLHCFPSLGPQDRNQFWEKHTVCSGGRDTSWEFMWSRRFQNTGALESGTRTRKEGGEQR